jgi:hypothetical protein
LIRARLCTLWQWALARLWYVHPPVTLRLACTPALCLRTLASAARPSTQRLHLRNLFAEGRRYYLHPASAGFQMNSTSKLPWSLRRRTRVAAVIFGSFDFSDGTTLLRLRARMTLPFLLDVLLLPLWMGLLLAFGPLPAPVSTAAAAALLALSWLWHRYEAALQAAEMVYFARVALTSLIEADAPALAAGDTIFRDFQAEWEKFYDARRPN